MKKFSALIAAIGAVRLERLGDPCQPPHDPWLNWQELYNGKDSGLPVHTADFDPSLRKVTTIAAGAEDAFRTMREIKRLESVGAKTWDEKLTLKQLKEGLELDPEANATADIEGVNIAGAVDKALKE